MSEEDTFELANFEYENMIAGGFETLYPNPLTVENYFFMLVASSNDTQEGTNDLLKEWVLCKQEMNKGA